MNLPIQKLNNRQQLIICWFYRTMKKILKKNISQGINGGKPHAPRVAFKFIFCPFLYTVNVTLLPAEVCSSM
jgi:hypothetical protein